MGDTTAGITLKAKQPLVRTTTMKAPRKALAITRNLSPIEVADKKALKVARSKATKLANKEAKAAKAAKEAEATEVVTVEKSATSSQTSEAAVDMDEAFDDTTVEMTEDTVDGV